MKWKLNLNWPAIGRHLFVSFALFAGLLSITNIDSLIHEARFEQDFARARIKLAKERLREHLQAAKAKVISRKLESLRESLEQDEFGELNPFANLSTLDPITAVLARGVKGYTRSTFRSPEYTGDNGYDLVHYEVQHPDGKTSVIMAYLEKPLTASGGGNRIPFVMVMTTEGDHSSVALYKGGTLEERSEIDTREGESRISQRLNAGVPFLSVSR